MRTLFRAEQKIKIFEFTTRKEVYFIITSFYLLSPGPLLLGKILQVKFHLRLSELRIYILCSNSIL